MTLVMNQSTIFFESAHSYTTLVLNHLRSFYLLGISSTNLSRLATTAYFILASVSFEFKATQVSNTHINVSSAAIKYT